MVVVTRAALRRRAPSEEVPYIPPELTGITKRLVEAREQSGLSISAVGTSRMERGYRLKKLTAIMVVRIARKLRVSAHWLLTGEGPMRVPGEESRPSRHPASIRAEEVSE